MNICPHGRQPGLALRLSGNRQRSIAFVNSSKLGVTSFPLTGCTEEMSAV